MLPPVPAAFPPPPAHQPWTEQQRTSVLPPVSAQQPLLRSARYEDEEPPPRRGRNPLMYAGLGAAAFACVAGIAAFSLGGGDDPATKAQPVTGAPSAASSAPVAPPSASASARPSTSAKPSASPKASLPVQLAQLRADIAQAAFARERDRQDDLTRLLDQAAQDVNDHRADDAEGALKDAQRLLRDLQKRKAADAAAMASWQARLTALLAAVHAQAQKED